MAVTLQLRKGTTAENDAFTGSIGEVTVDTTTNTLRVHDGTNSGGQVVGRTYTAGNGLVVSNDQFSLADNGVGASQLKIDGNGTSGQVLISDGDGTFSYETLLGGTGVTYNSGTISIGQSVGSNDNVSFNNITADGNLTVNDTVVNSFGNIVLDPSTQIVEIRGDGSSVVGQLQLNCHVNTHGQIIASQPHSENATNVLTLPGGDTIGNADAVLVSDTGTQTLTNKTISSPTFSGQITGDLIPSADVTHDLGSTTNRWKDLFLSGNTIDIGGATISFVGGSFEFKDSSGNDAEISLAANTTDDLSEGSSNLYYTDARTRAALSASGDLTYNALTGEFSVTVPAGYDSSDFDTDFSGKSTDDLSEGTTNLYYTDTRAQNALAATGDLTYDSTTGIFNFVERTDAEVRELLSASGDLLYDSVTGQFSVTTYKDADVESYLSGGTGVSFSGGVISVGQSIGTTDDVTFNNVNVNGTLSTDDVTAATVTASNDVIIQGNLTVNGTTSTVSSEDINTTSATITLVDGLGDNTAPSQNAGLVINRGSEPDRSFLFDEAVDKWTIGSETLIAGLIESDVVGTVSDISNHSTDDLSEGTTNLYYTDSRSRSAINGGTGIAYVSSTGTVAIDNTVATLDDTQTLTNKTLDLTDNTLSATLSQLNGSLSDATLITEAPQDGNAYVRQNGQWVDINNIVYSSSTAT